MKFKDESDLRRWFKKKCQGLEAEVLWVEAGRGGTQGMPDAIAVGGGHALFAELKVGERKGNRVEFQMDNTQRMILRKLEAADMDVVVIVAEKDTSLVWSAKPSLVRVEKNDRKVTKVRGRCAHSIPADEIPFDDEWS